MLRLRRAVSLRRTFHDARVPRVHFEGAILGALVRILGGVHDESAVEALGRAEPIGADLMAHRAGNAVGRLATLLVAHIEREMREDLSLPAAQLGLVARDRHVARRALIL